jgi:hypothetical protein
MDTVLKAFPLQLVFRGIFPGAFFVLSYLVAAKGWAGAAADARENLLHFWLPVAVFAGVVAYTIHRSLVYPIIEGLLDAGETYGGGLIKERTIKRLIRNWSVGEHECEFLNVSKHLTAWNDYLQLQYASALCLLAGGVAAWAIGETVCPSCPLTFLFLILAISGIVSERRQRAVADAAFLEFGSQRESCRCNRIVNPNPPG